LKRSRLGIENGAVLLNHRVLMILIFLENAVYWVNIIQFKFWLEILGLFRKLTSLGELISTVASSLLFNRNFYCNCCGLPLSFISKVKLCNMPR
jgi:hypothetical protein